MDFKSYLDEFKKEQEIELKELERYVELIDQINLDTFYSFKTRINNRKNMYLTVKNGTSFVRKIEVQASIKYNKTTATCLDNKGYEVTFKPEANKRIKTPEDMFEFLGLDLRDYNKSKQIKNFDISKYE